MDLVKLQSPRTGWYGDEDEWLVHGSKRGDPLIKGSLTARSLQLWPARSFTHPDLGINDITPF